MRVSIPFCKTWTAPLEAEYVAQVLNGESATDGQLAESSSQLLEERLGVGRVLLTPSCTSALELAALLCELGPGDEVVMPSFTFPATANSVARTGATPVFVDVRADTMNIDEQLIPAALTERTKAIFVMHYGESFVRWMPSTTMRLNGDWSSWRTQRKGSMRRTTVGPPAVSHRWRRSAFITRRA